MYCRVFYVKYFTASHSFVFYQIISNFLLSRTIFNTAYWSHYLPADCNPAVSTGTWPSTKRTRTEGDTVACWNSWRRRLALWNGCGNGECCESNISWRCTR